MARNRMIKPEYWTSKTLVRVSRESRLLFIGLWNFADDYGVLEDSNRRILGDIFPYDESVSEKDIEKWKMELLNENLLVKIQFNGHDYLHIRSWNEHQKVAHPGKETIPKTCIHESLMNTSRDSQPQIEREIEVEKEIEIIMSEKKLDGGKVFLENSDEFKLAKLLWNLIRENNQKAKEPNLQKWAYEVEKMLKKDNRTFKEIEFLIRWSQQDSFWKTNILSIPKLREKFDQLYIKAKSEWEKTKESSIPSFVNPYANN